MRGNRDVWRRLERRVATMVLAIAVAAPCAVAADTEAPAVAAPAMLPGAPEILRGSVAAPTPSIEPAAGPADNAFVAGDRVWFIDQSARRLTGCRLVNTMEVGGQAIWCTERRLPRGAASRD